VNDNYKNISRIACNAILAIYPFLIIFFLIIQIFPIRIFSIFIIALAVLEFIFRISKRKSDKKLGSNLWNSLVLVVIGVLCFITKTNMAYKLFPVFINLILICSFGSTLFQPPSMIYRFAVLADKTIPESPVAEKIAAYCHKVTVLWVVFFAINASIAAWTVFCGSDSIWIIYNGGVANVLVGIMFAGEFIVRKFVQKKISHAVDTVKE